MPSDPIRYDVLIQDALRGVMRRILADVAKNGLPGTHHFFITFDTRAPGVQLADRLRERYPQEMTIVLQHQFWNLRVGDEAFEVGLSFGGVPERLSIPFAAIKSFADPSVQFGLQFEAAAASPADEQKGEPSPSAAAPESDGAAMPAPPAVPAAGEMSQGSEPQDKPAAGAEVVRLDRFRKK